MRRGVTRGQTWVILAGVVVAAVATVITSWAFLSLFGDLSPVATAGIAPAIGPGIIVMCAGLLLWVLWGQTLVLLRGDSRVPWGSAVVSAGGSYLVWCMLGMAVGMSVSDTWLSPFAVVLACVWACAVLMGWAVMCSRISAAPGRLVWPWERAE